MKTYYFSHEEEGPSNVLKCLFRVEGIQNDQQFRFIVNVRLIMCCAVKQQLKKTIYVLTICFEKLL